MAATSMVLSLLSGLLVKRTRRKPFSVAVNRLAHLHTVMELTLHPWCRVARMVAGAMYVNAPFWLYPIPSEHQILVDNDNLRGRQQSSKFTYTAHVKTKQDD